MIRFAPCALALLALLVPAPARANFPAWPVTIQVSTGETGQGVTWLTSWRTAAFCVSGEGIRCEGSFPVRNRVDPVAVPFTCTDGSTGVMTVQMRRAGLIVVPVRGSAELSDGRRISASFGRTDSSLPRGCPQ